MRHLNVQLDIKDGKISRIELSEIYAMKFKSFLGKPVTKDILNNISETLIGIVTQNMAIYLDNDIYYSQLLKGSGFVLKGHDQLRASASGLMSPEAMKEMKLAQVDFHIEISFLDDTRKIRKFYILQIDTKRSDAWAAYLDKADDYEMKMNKIHGGDGEWKAYPDFKYDDKEYTQHISMDAFEGKEMNLETLTDIKDASVRAMSNMVAEVRDGRAEEAKLHNSKKKK